LRWVCERGGGKVTVLPPEPEIIDEKDFAAFDPAIETNIASRAMRQGGCLYFGVVLDTYLEPHHHHVTA
jgi:hypothetical protein